jgi:hypothetical protein
MSDPTAELLSEVRGFIADVNSGNASDALQRLTEDVCIVEDIAPFRWTGTEAGGQWLAAMGANAQRLGVTAITMNPGEAQRIEIEGNYGYCIVPGMVLLERKGTALREDGLITFAMQFEGEQWRISALIWTGNRPTEA